MFSALFALIRELDDEISRYCRIDTGIYHLELVRKRAEDSRYRVQFRLHLEKPRVRRVTTETGDRPAYWCGMPDGPRGIKWVEWPRSLVGLPDGPMLPVYVQGHALDNLYRKEARALFIWDGEWMVHDYLHISLEKPKIAPMPRRPGKFLVEYRLSIHKLGFPWSRGPWATLVLIESFLFLTMNETPEGDLLWKKLRLRKEDKILLELDRIETFLLTDMSNSIPNSWGS